MHGRFTEEGGASERERQSRVARLAIKHGFAVLALRGKLGECGDAGLADYWCWPSNPRNAGDAWSFVERAHPALAAAEAKVGAGRRLLVGFSNGGYFATLIATQALLPFDAIVIAHAGPVPPTRAKGPKPPVLLITADDDPSNDEMIQLSAELKRLAWPHEIVAREGGHELPDWDVEMALSFFARTRTESLPLAPPLSSRRPRPSPASDAATSLDADAPDAARIRVPEDDGGGAPAGDPEE